MAFRQDVTVNGFAGKAVAITAITNIVRVEVDEDGGPIRITTRARERDTGEKIPNGEITYVFGREPTPASPAVVDPVTGVVLKPEGAEYPAMPSREQFLAMPRPDGTGTWGDLLASLKSNGYQGLQRFDPRMRDAVEG